MPHAIDTLYPFLRVELPGIPEPLLVSAVAKTVNDFLRMSEVWKYTTPTLLDWTTALVFPAINVGTEIPAETRATRIDTVKYAPDGVSLREVPFKTRQQLDNIYSDWEVKTGNTPLYWTYDGPGVPRIVPIAVANVLATIQIRTVLGSTESLVNLPDFIMHEFEDTIREGVLARLMKIPGKDWTNLTAAAAYASLFKAGYTKAKSRAQAEFGQPARETSYGGL